MTGLTKQFRPTSVVIDLSALRHNAQIVKKYSPDSKFMAVIKANAYGHGINQTALALKDSVDEFGVASMDDAMAINSVVGDFPISVFSGLTDRAEVMASKGKAISFFVYDQSQLDLLSEVSNELEGTTLSVWIKVDTGMSRLGFSVDSLLSVVNKLEGIKNIHIRGVVSHHANSDQPEHELNQKQRNVFHQLREQFQDKNWQWSLANSGGLISSVKHQYDWVRSGIVLYGSSPLVSQSIVDIGLKPVMTLQSQLISVRGVSAGDSVGYGSQWTADKDMLVGVVACGYGDGYPRHIAQNTAVLVNEQKTMILGRVSMDLIVVSLDGINAKVGSRVELWGDTILVDDIAQSAETISYELMCGITQRVERIYKY